MDFAWAAQEFAEAKVRDPRRITSLVRICGKLAVHPGVSFSAAVGPASRQAATRIFSHPMLQPSHLLAGHVAQTVRRCRAHPVILAAQDTTVFDFQTHPATTGLGPTNDSLAGWGLFGHSVLALTPAGEPLGLLHLEFWTRDPAEHGKKAARHRKATGEKESQKWGTAHAAVEQALPDGPTVLLVQDRESDVFAFLARPRLPHVHFLVRAYQPRSVLLPVATTQASLPAEPAGNAGQGPPRASAANSGAPVTPADPACRVDPTPEQWRPAPERLPEVAAQAPRLGEIEVAVGPRGTQPARKARVELRACRLRLRRPGSLRAAEAPAVQELWVLRATEVGTPTGVKPLDWLLLTTWPVPDAATAAAVVGYYARRWGIERLHYTLKTGQRVERLQFDDRASLQNALAVQYVVAWRLLYLTHHARTEPTAPATELFPSAELTVLAAATRRPVETVRDAVRATAVLGGWEAYPAAGEPGVLALWRGLARLEALTEGWRLAQTLSHPLKDMNQA